jgi:hypothetical protein
MLGAPHNLYSPHLLTDNGLIHAELLKTFKAIFNGEVLHPMPPVK